MNINILKNNYNIREELIMKFSFYFNNLLVKKVNRSIKVESE